MGRFTENGSAELYYDNVLRLSTTNTGVTITTEAVVGNGTNGLQFSHSTGNSSGIINTGFSSTAVEIRTGNVQRMLINSTSATFAGNVSLLDSKFLNLGSNNDLQIAHNATDSTITNSTGNIDIIQNADDKDIILRCDNGSGGNTPYITLNGFAVRTDVLQNFRVQDNILFQVGSSGDFTIRHNGTDSYLQNDTGDLYIKQNKSDADIIFQSDDGAGGEATYFYLDGSGVLTRFDKRLRMSDGVGLQLGSSGNFEMYHLNGNTTMDNFTGNLTIRNSANDKDISFACDDGSGGAAEYFKLDGLNGRINFSVDAQFADNKKS